MTKKNILAGNWKMNLGVAQSTTLSNEYLQLSQNLQKTELWAAPSAMALPACAAVLQDSKVMLGAQNVHWAESGAFTGELSVPMLREVGCSFALVGHSERRHAFGETNELVAQRALAALAAHFTTVLCIGETLDEREAGKTIDTLVQQLQVVIPKLASADTAKLVIAYEPVWAIGTGKVASVAEINEVHESIYNHWQANRSEDCPPILYGGSVSPENFADIIAIDKVAGALIGGASLKADKMAAMASISEKTG